MFLEAASHEYATVQGQTSPFTRAHSETWSRGRTTPGLPVWIHTHQARNVRRGATKTAAQWETGLPVTQILLLTRSCSLQRQLRQVTEAGRARPRGRGQWAHGCDRRLAQPHTCVTTRQNRAKDNRGGGSSHGHHQVWLTRLPGSVRQAAHLSASHQGLCPEKHDTSQQLPTSSMIPHSETPPLGVAASWICAVPAPVVCRVCAQRWLTPHGVHTEWPSPPEAHSGSGARDHAWSPREAQSLREPNSRTTHNPQARPLAAWLTRHQVCCVIPRPTRGISRSLRSPCVTVSFLVLPSNYFSQVPPLGAPHHRPWEPVPGHLQPGLS